MALTQPTQYSLLWLTKHASAFMDKLVYFSVILINFDGCKQSLKCAVDSPLGRNRFNCFPYGMNHSEKKICIRKCLKTRILGKRYHMQDNFVDYKITEDNLVPD